MSANLLTIPTYDIYLCYLTTYLPRNRKPTAMPKPICVPKVVSSSLRLSTLSSLNRSRSPLPASTTDALRAYYMYQQNTMPTRTR